MVFMALFCAAIKRDPLSPSRFTLFQLGHVRVISFLLLLHIIIIINSSQ